MSLRLGAVLVFCAAPAVAQQLCLTDHTEMMDRNPEGFDAAIRSVTMAHLPVELRNSCAGRPRQHQCLRAYGVLSRRMPLSLKPTAQLRLVLPSAAVLRLPPFARAPS